MGEEERVVKREGREREEKGSERKRGRKKDKPSWRGKRERGREKKITKNVIKNARGREEEKREKQRACMNKKENTYRRGDGGYLVIWFSCNHNIFS